MEASISWIEEATFLAESRGGHTVTIDGPGSEDGRIIGMCSIEVMLMGMGGCTSLTS